MKKFLKYFSFKWVIPFTYKFQKSDKSELKWINLTDSFIQIPLNEETEKRWILGNLNFMGYYRVNYDKQNWLKIINQLKEDHTVFTSTERAALIFDSFTLAR
jgi:aminopeptidase N